MFGFCVVLDVNEEEEVGGGDGEGWRRGVRSFEDCAMYCFGLSRGDGAELEVGQVSV